MLGGVDCTPEIRQVLRDAGVVVAWVFGSRATGRATPSSDIDVAVCAEDGRAMGLLELSRLERALDTLLEGPADVTDFGTAPLELRARIVTEGRVLCSDDEPLRVRLTVDTQSRWEDLRPALREMDRAYLAAVADRPPAGGAGG